MKKFNTVLSVIDKFIQYTKNISKHMDDLYNMTNKSNITVMFRIL